MKIPHKPSLKNNSKELRKAGNLSEALLWQQLKGGQCGVFFNRQKIIGSYIVDFYCAEIKTVIEVDGESHNHKPEYDKKRDEYLHGLGLTVLHILDADIKRNLEGVVQFIELYIKEVKK